MPNLNPDLDRAVADCPSSWFLQLETALRHGVYDAEREALQNLRRLGVLIEIDPDVATRKWMRRAHPITNRGRRRRSRAS
jgi:hypothetical protein